MLRGTFILLVAALVFASPFATAQDYPELDSYVTDLADALYSFEEEDIGRLCESVYLQTGAEMAVLVVNATYPDEISLFATRTFQQNGLGQKGEDNGLLIVVATDDGEWRVEVGYGLEGYLPDALVGNYSETYLVPPMQYGDYGTGLYDLVNNLGGIILEDYVGEPVKDPYPISFIPLTFWQLVVVGAVFVFLTVATKGRIILWIPFIFSGGRGGKNWGGGRTGGGGAGGKWR
jgi:uncharacterized protein